MAKWVFINKDFVKEDKAFLHVKDLAFQRGYGVFDFFRLVENTPLFLDDHLHRFRQSAEAMHLPFDSDANELKTIIHSLIGKNKTPNSGVRLSLTGGYSEDGFTLAKPNFVVSQHGFMPPGKKQFHQGVRLVSYPYQRQLPVIKTIDYVMAIWLQPFKIQAGADDVLYHNKGVITECPRNNFFLVTKDNKIITPSENVLKGVTRKKVIAVAATDFIVEERPIHLHELATAKEAFITSTTKQLLPVAAIDGKTFPNRSVSTVLLQRFRDSYAI